VARDRERAVKVPNQNCEYVRIELSLHNIYEDFSIVATHHRSRRR
jgi:hypothetical protein